MIIIPDRFVYLHLPKTGGTFVTTALKRVYDPPRRKTPWARLLRKVTRRPYLNMLKHGWARDIPERYAHLPIVGCVRNPYDKYVSMFHFQWWKRHPEDFPALAAHPAYPELSFDQYVRAM